MEISFVARVLRPNILDISNGALGEISVFHLKMKYHALNIETGR